MNFESVCVELIEEKNRAKLKPLSGFDYYKGIRKPTPPPGTSFKDKKKYNRRDKFKRDYE
jgi:hypothetical protein